MAQWSELPKPLQDKHPKEKVNKVRFNTCEDGAGTSVSIWEGSRRFLYRYKGGMGHGKWDLQDVS